jgi:hypothetical protein
MPLKLMTPFAPAALACLALLLAGCKQDAKTEPSENALADVAAQMADADSTEVDDAGEAVLDDEDLDNAEVLPSETTNLFVSADEQVYREELQARAARRQEKEQQEAETQAAGAAAAAAAPIVAVATAEAQPKAAVPAPAMEETAILQEKNGQWATTAEASSTYGNASGKDRYTAWQATGAPNVPRYSDHVDSWATKNGDSPTPDWLQVGFAKPVHATSIRIRQNAAPGAISRIELLDTDGGIHNIWEGTDATSYQKNTIGWLVRDFDATPYQVKGARITIESNRVWGWNEIDAVQLVGEEK